MKIMLSCIMGMYILCCAVTSWSGQGVVTGRLMLKDGSPLSKGQVFFFETESETEKPVVGKYWKVPSILENVDENGSFSVELEEGTYYIAAIKRMEKDVLGPPQDGDFFLPSHDKKGVYRIVTVRSDATTDLGAIKGIERYQAKNYRYRGKLTALEGKLATMDGVPVKGMYVFAYTDQSMRGRPLFVSARSGKDGRFFLPVDTGRTFYLKVRNMYAGGTPKTGDLVGVYGSVDEPAPAVTKPSSITRGINIQLYPFSGQGRQNNGENN